MEMIIWRNASILLSLLTTRCSKGAEALTNGVQEELFGKQYRQTAWILISILKIKSIIINCIEHYMYF